MRRKDREISSVEDFLDVLDSCRTVCVAMIDNDIPYVVPLSYGYELSEESLILYLHCAKEGRKIDVLEENNKVCFTIYNEGEPMHAETPCNSGYYYSSIIGNGTVEFIDDINEKKYALNKLVAHQMGIETEFTDVQVDSVCVFKIISKEYSGKRKEKQ